MVNIVLMSKLFLIPNFIDDNEHHLCSFDASTIQHLRSFFVEEPKAARALLRSIMPKLPLQDCRFHDLNEHSTSSMLIEYKNIIKAEDSGIISESGCPCIADPGANLVLLAHAQGIDVIPLVGPSSILLALMASGLSGQNFAFSGYLPKDPNERHHRIKMLEQRAAKEIQTQIFMETPYRNISLWEELLKTLDGKTLLCVALDISGSQQFIQTKSVQEWQKNNLQLPKKPALFIINKS